MKKSFLGILFIFLFSGVAVQLDAAAESPQDLYEASLNEGFDWLGAYAYQIIEKSIGKQLNNSENLIKAMNLIGKQVFEPGSQSPRRPVSPESPRRQSGSGPELNIDPQGLGYDEKKGVVGGAESSPDPFAILNSPQPNPNQPTVGTQDEDLFSSFSDLAGGSTSGSSSVDFSAFPFQDVGFQSGEREEGEVVAGNAGSDILSSSGGPSENIGDLFDFYLDPLNKFLGLGKK